MVLGPGYRKRCIKVARHNGRKRFSTVIIGRSKWQSPLVPIGSDRVPTFAGRVIELFAVKLAM